MKVLMVFPRVPYPLKDGGAIAMNQMIKGLCANGLELTLFFLNTSKHYVSDEIIKKEFNSLGDVKASYIKNDINIFGVIRNLFSSKSYHISRFENEESTNKFVEVLKSQPFDVVHFEGIQSTVFFRQVKKFSSALSVLRQHNVEHLIWERNAVSEKGVKRRYFELLAKRLKRYEDSVLKEIDAVIPISEVDGQYFKKFCDQVFVSPTGVSLSGDKINDFKTNSVFHLGSLDWVPNLLGLNWFLNEVWPLILQKNSSFVFKIGGRNLDKDLEKKLKIHKNVEVVGEVANSEEFMSKNGVMVVPLLSGSGIRIKVIEGLSRGVPIVSTSIGIEGLGVTNGKEVLIEDSPSELAEAILGMNQEQMSKISNNGVEFIREKFDNNVISLRLISFYKSLVKKV